MGKSLGALFYGPLCILSFNRRGLKLEYWALQCCSSYRFCWLLWTRAELQLNVGHRLSVMTENLKNLVITYEKLLAKLMCITGMVAGK